MTPTLTGIVDPNGSVVGTHTGQFFINTNKSNFWYWDGNLSLWIELIKT